MIQKASVYKAVISAIALFSFVHWGLETYTICKVLGEPYQNCGESSRNEMANMIGLMFAFMLVAMAGAILLAWVSSCWIMGDARR